MLSKIAVLLAVASLAAYAMTLLTEERQDASELEQEVVGQLNALREHLFKR
jgi:hypothetical protein